jgi:hypothetical protein
MAKTWQREAPPPKAEDHIRDERTIWGTLLVTDVGSPRAAGMTATVEIDDRPRAPAK